MSGFYWINIAALCENQITKERKEICVTFKFACKKDCDLNSVLVCDEFYKYIDKIDLADWEICGEIYEGDPVTEKQKINCHDITKLEKFYALFSCTCEKTENFKTKVFQIPFEFSSIYAFWEANGDRFEYMYSKIDEYLEKNGYGHYCAYTPIDFLCEISKKCFEDYQL